MLLLVLSFFLGFSAYAYNNDTIITDRPSKTEGPYTVSPGHYQLETDLMNYSYNPGEKSESLLYFNNMNIKAGINNRNDVEFFIPTVVKERAITDSGRESRTGFGDMIVREKFNFFGNDSGDALGMITFVKLPTGGASLSNKKFEGGVQLPYSSTVFTDWNLGLMAQVNHSRRESDIAYQTDFVFTATLGHTLVGDLSWFAELFGQASDVAEADALATFDLGLTYLLENNIQLDTGVFLGLNDASDDYNTFLGLSVLY